jgi:hypothetical protein
VVVFIGILPAHELRAAMCVIGKHQRTRPPTRSDEMKNVRIDAFAPAARGQFFGKIMRDGSLGKKGRFTNGRNRWFFVFPRSFKDLREDRQSA